MGLTPQTFSRLARVFYFPTGRSVTGHISIQLPDRVYVSHVPDRSTRPNTPRFRRRDIPGMEGRNLVVQAFPAARYRTFQQDVEAYGTPEEIDLPRELMLPDMIGMAQGHFLNGGVLEGPMFRYQLADSVAGAGDRLQCATVTAQIVAAGIPSANVDMIRRLQRLYTPADVAAFCRSDLPKHFNNRPNGPDGDGIAG